MATVGDIAIVVGADVGPMVRELGKGKGALADFGSTGSRMGALLGSTMARAAIGVGVAATALGALTKTSMANIDAMSKQARAVGISVASFQSMAMVAEEAGVQSDQLSKILIKMQDNIASLGTGTATQVEQFRALGVSMADLAGLGADEQFALIAEKIASIKDPAAQTAAALNIFGRSGADAITMLGGFGAAAAEAAKFQQDFGIAVSDIDAQQIEAANDAIGRMAMAGQGLGNVLAVTLAPAVEQAAGMFQHLALAITGAQNTGIAFFNNMANYNAVMEKFGSVDAAAALAGGWRELEAILAETNAIERLEEIRQGYEQFAEGIGRGSMVMTGDLKQLSAEFPVLAEAISSMIRHAYDLGLKLQAALDAGDVEAAQQYSAELKVAVSNLEKAMSSADALSGLDMSGAVGWANNLASALGLVASAAAKAAAAVNGIPGTDTGTPLGAADGNMPPTFESGMTSSPNAPSAPNGIGGIDWGAPTGGGGGGGGGGGSNPMTARIEALVESLRTEAEIVAVWYEESLAALNAATEAELAALGGKHEAIERLEEEHQDRLAGIREMGNQWSLQSALAGGAEILGAMGAFNKKALKAASIFSAAQALISTYEGAAKELRKGTLGFATAAAVIAKGIGFIAAIKSAGNGGGGGGGGGGGASAAAAAPQAPVTNMNFTVTNDRFGIGERVARQISEQINAARRNGSQIIATVTSQ